MNASLRWIRKQIAHLDGFTVIDGGGINGHWMQLAYQLADSVAGFAYAFGGTCILLFLMNLIPGLSLRTSEEAEILGIDDAELGEFAVSFLFSEVWTKMLIPSSTIMLSLLATSLLMTTLP